MWLDDKAEGEGQPDDIEWSLCKHCGPILLAHHPLVRPHYGERYSYVVLPQPKGD